MTEQDIKDKALEVYPYDIQGQYAYDANDGKRQGYIKGYQDAIQQLNKEAVDGICISNGKECGSTIETPAGMLFFQHNRFNVGDKVKLVIIKE